jgi:hypothetical protein
MRASKVLKTNDSVSLDSESLGKQVSFAITFTLLFGEELKAIFLCEA